jgi:TRAP-type C4-dicarboxylate transport system permease small subunit
MKIVNFLSRVASYVAMVTVIAMMLLTVTDVTLLYVFTRPISGVSEITEYMLAICLLGIVPCALENRHIKVDIIVENLPPKAAAVLEAVTLFISIIMGAIMTWRSFGGGVFAIQNGVASAMLEVPAFPFYWVVGLSFGLMVVVMISMFIKRIAQVVSA